MDFTGSMQRYFSQEKSESLVFIIVGFAAIAFALWCWLGTRQPFYRGMIVPLVSIAMIQIVVGSTVYFRTNSQVSNLTAQFQTDKKEFAEEETLRMKAVMNSFKVYKIIEAALIAAALVLLLVPFENEMWKGVGIGLLVQSCFMIVLDIFAERRGAEYIQELTKLAG